MARRSRIIMVDDETDLAEAHAEYLTELGHQVSVLASTAELDLYLERETVDLVILDLNLPGERGLDALRRLRDKCPILIFSGHADFYDRVVGLELGAVDVVSKPIDPRELAARVLGILQRHGRIERELITFENTTVDITASCLLRDGLAPERLSPGEIALIRLLASRPNAVLSRGELIELAPAESREAGDKSIDRRIARLRIKLDTARIVTVRGRGYMLVGPA